MVTNTEHTGSYTKAHGTNQYPALKRAVTQLLCTRAKHSKGWFCESRQDAQKESKRLSTLHVTTMKIAAAMSDMSISSTDMPCYFFNSPRVSYRTKGYIKETTRLE